MFLCFIFFEESFIDLVSYARPSQGDKTRVIQTLLFVSGINTLLQALFGTRLPTVVGGSFAYVIPILYIIRDSSLQRIPDPHEVSSCSLTALSHCKWSSHARHLVYYNNAN